MKPPGTAPVDAPDPPQPAPDAARAARTAALPLRTGLRLLLPLLVVVSLLLLAGATAVGVRWVLATEAGSLWLLQHLPRVQVQGFSGALWGDRWRAQSLRIQWGTEAQWLLIEGLAADGLRWAWRPHDQAWLGLDMQRMAVRQLSLGLGPASGQPFTLPADITLPLQLSVAQLQIDTLLADGKPVLNGLAVQGLVLDPRPGAQYQIESLALQAAGISVAGALRVGHVAPYPLTAQATLRPTLDGDAPRWAAVLQAGGSAAEMQVNGTLRGRPAPGRDAPTLDLRAGLRPLAAWPLASLDMQTQALDLAALSPLAPATRLSGRATLAGGAANTPLTATLALDNALPGRWNEQRLPLQKLALALSGTLARPERVDITRFDLALADATGPAGRWSGNAVWQGSELALDSQLTAVTPQRLDGRAAAMTLAGPVALTLRGLPSPDPAARRTPASAAGAASLPAAAAAASASASASPSVQWKIDLQGRLDGAPQPVQVSMEGRADHQRLDITRAQAQAGNASADLKATLVRGARGAWAATSSGTVQDFDPVPWWPGDAGTAWRKGPHRLSGEWQFGLQLPADAATLPPVALAQRLAGNGSLRIHDALLAGVPLAADITLGSTLGSTPGTPQGATPTSATLTADVRLGGNQIVLEGRGDPSAIGPGSGGNDRWRLTLKADALAALAPLAGLSPALSDWVPRQGSASAELTADGRWPLMRTEGTARLSQLQLGRLGMARGNAKWALDTGGDQALSLQLELAGLALGTQRADNVRADLRGTLADHRIDISGALPLVPPAFAEQVLGIQAQSGTRGQMQAQGGWRADAAGGGRWQARIERLVIGSWDGSADTAPPASGWVEARDLKAELQFDAAGALIAVQADPGAVRVADAVGLRWDAVRVDLRGSPAQVQLRLDVEPFALAPLLARAQPGMGWQGDLRLAARLDIRAAEKLDADLVFERRDGDLYLAGTEGTQLMGLTELRLALSAHEGLWNFKHAFRGRSLGEITGQMQLQTTADQRWPPAATPITGDLQARVADIGIWSAWVPAGWRLAGDVRTSAQISGSFGQPQFTGELTAAGLGVRNLLQGVNLTDGQVAIRLAGDVAQIERFTLRGGDGLLTLSGNATLGRTPKANVQIKAEKFRVLGRVDRQVITSGQAQLQVQPDQTRLEGKFTLDEALFDASRDDAPSLDDDVTVRLAGAAPDTAANPEAPKVRRNFVLGLDIDLGDNTRVRGRGLETSLSGQLRVSTPGGRLAVNGTINTERGTYAAYGQKLDIERGIIAFSGGVDNPRLDVLALRPNIDTRVGVAITGNLLTPRVRLFSEPDMSDTDKLSWLVLGRAPDGLGRNDTALLQRAAVALLSGEGEAPTDALLKNLGIDEISLRQGDGEVRETVITLGKQLSRRWYVGYERGVNATTGTWQLIYRIAQRFTLRAQSGMENALDVIWTWRLQEAPANATMRTSPTAPP